MSLEAQVQALQSEKKCFQALIKEKQGIIARLQKRMEEQDKTFVASAGLGSRMGPWPGGFADIGEGSGAREERLARAATEVVAEVSPRGGRESRQEEECESPSCRREERE